MGIQARSAIISVITSSYGCISPICRLPISRMIQSSVIKIITVRIKIRLIKTVSFLKIFLCAFWRAKNIAKYCKIAFFRTLNR